MDALTAATSHLDRRALAELASAADAQDCAREELAGWDREETDRSLRAFYGIEEPGALEDAEDEQERRAEQERDALSEMDNDPEIMEILDAGRGLEEDAAHVDQCQAQADENFLAAAVAGHTRSLRAQVTYKILCIGDRSALPTIRPLHERIALRLRRAARRITAAILARLRARLHVIHACNLARLTRAGRAPAPPGAGPAMCC